MGKYINGIGTNFQEKMDNLSFHHKALVIPKPKEFVENLVCLVDDGAFAVAAYCYDEKEFSQNDGRKKCWMLVPNVKELAR